MELADVVALLSALAVLLVTFTAWYPTRPRRPIRAPVKFDAGSDDAIETCDSKAASRVGGRNASERRFKKGRLKKLVTQQRLEIAALRKQVSGVRDEHVATENGTAGAQVVDDFKVDGESKESIENEPNFTPSAETFSASGITKETISSDSATVEELREHVALLVTQLKNAGVEAIEEVVSFEEGQRRLREATKRLLEGCSDLEAERELAKWDQYVRAHPQTAANALAEAAAWRAENEATNLACRAVVRGFVPADVSSNASVERLVGAGIDTAAAKRIFATPSLWLTRTPPERIARVHAADLRVRYHFSSLSLIELRALYACVPLQFEADDKGEKRAWRESLEIKLKETIKAKPALEKAAPACYGRAGRWALTALDSNLPPDILAALPLSPEDHAARNAVYKPSLAPAPPLPTPQPPPPAKGNWHSPPPGDLLQQLRSRAASKGSKICNENSSTTSKGCNPRENLLAAIQQRRRRPSCVGQPNVAGANQGETSPCRNRSPLKNCNVNSPSPRTKLAAVLKSAQRSIV